MSTTHTAHNAQANQAAVRRLVPPPPRPCSLCPFCHNHHSTALPSAKRYDKRYEAKGERTSENPQKAKFTGIAHLPHRPGREGLPQEGP